MVDRRKRPEHPDYFELVSNCQALYGLAPDCLKAIIKYEELAKSTSLGDHDRTDIRLALARIKRVRFLTSTSSAFEELKEIESATEGEEVSALRLRILRAEILVYRIADYRGAQADLEEAAEFLRNSSDQFLYAIVANALSIIHLVTGDLVRAENFAHDCISISRRLDSPLYAIALGNIGLMKKASCRYQEAVDVFQRALRDRVDWPGHRAAIFNNLAVVKKILGDWNSAEYYFGRSISLWKSAALSSHAKPGHHSAPMNLAHLQVLRRSFKQSVQQLFTVLESGSINDELRNKSLAHEFLAEAYLEQGDTKQAHEELVKAEQCFVTIAPESDVMTEIRRRRAQVYLLEGRRQDAKQEALVCIRLCRKIRDKHELGPALRILAQCHARDGLVAKANSAFVAAINTLRSINECYELMRTCVAYSEYLLDNDKPDVDIYILEAKQLCKKVEIDFYMSQIMLLQAKYEYTNEDYTAATKFLRDAEEICEKLQDCDRKAVAPRIKTFYDKLQKTILRSSMKSATQLKSLGEIYEDARFPLEELRPELAARIAQNVGAEALFLARKLNRGYSVPVCFNVSVKDAKNILRRDKERTIRELFGNKEPTVVTLPNDKTLVSVPGSTKEGYVLCTIIDSSRTFTPRELEFLFASIGALERVAVEYDTSSREVEGSEFVGGRHGHLKHPGGSFEDILTIDPGLIQVIHLAERAATKMIPILLEGETGVGKELFASAIHFKSPRKDRPFIAINAGGIPLNLLESQLFGHVRGAFTDAVTDRTGLVEEARGGTLFFDEVGEMAEELQVKLLRLLENGEYRRLGENQVRYADVRVVSATNKDLEGLVKAGDFREDLFYRIATVNLTIPPLRARKRDIEFLVRHFLHEGLAALGEANRPVHVDLKALEAFEHYDWPGNVRELKNEMLRNLSLIGNGEVIRFGMLSRRITDAFGKKDGGQLGERVERLERRLILKALEENDWNKIRTAEQIGIPRTTLLFKMKRLDIVR